MAWIIPKTNWLAGQGIADTDLNRIEGNIEHLGDSFWLSGGLNEDRALAGSAFHPTNRLVVNAPDVYDIVLRREILGLIGADLRMRIKVDTVLVHTSTGATGDTTPDIVLISNISGSPASYQLDFDIFNSTGSPTTIFQGSGWSLKMEVKPT